MSEENKALARKFFRMLELGDSNMAEEIVAVDYYNHDVPDPSVGREGLKGFVHMLKNALPDAQVNIDYQLADRDKVVSRYTISGTHQGELFGVSATGKRVSWTTMATHRITDSKIRETWINWDQFGLMQQLGVAPTQVG